MGSTTKENLAGERTQHTPGPWRVDGRFVMASKGAGAIAETFPHGPGKTAGTAEANARLIAAAPELLEALKLLANRIAPMPRPMMHQMSDTELVTMADAVVAKAEGK